MPRAFPNSPLAVALAAVAVSAGAALPAAATCYSSFPACPVSGDAFKSTLLATAAFPTGTAGQPMAFVDPHDRLGHRFVPLHGGRILVWDGGAGFLATDLLDLTGRIELVFNEQGLLAMAVHPAYRQNGWFYVSYTSNGGPGPGQAGDIVLERYTRSAADPNVADPGSAQVVLVIDHQEAVNHNGGWLAFGPDGYLYVSTGDGGNGCDTPIRDAQDTHSLRGKLLRLDVDGPDAYPGDPLRNYALPPDNPFASGVDGAPEVWDYGLRNPFRFSFDRATGDLFVGDVGQSNWEEIDYHGAITPAPVNFGWVCREGCDTSATGGSSCSLGGGECTGNTGTTCQYPTASGLWDPILCFSNTPWVSIMGGYRYRGAFLPADQHGRYFFADASFGSIWRTDPVDLTTASCWDDGNSGIYAFAEDHLGELYVVNGGAKRIECLHAGVASGGCYWAHWGGLFEDGFESGDTARWSATAP